jgi:hypothetical protein
MEKKIMFCPMCYEKLQNGEERKFETLTDHVCDPNREDYPLRPTWICTNAKCECGLSNDIFWDETGDIYGGFKLKFPDDRDSAYPSHSRKSDIEIYKKGLKKQTYLPAFLMLWFLKPMIEHNYKGDEWGDVLGRSFKLKFLRKDKINLLYKDRFGYHVYYTFPWVSLFRSLKRNYDTIHNKKLSQTYKYGSVCEMFEDLPTWEKRIWRKLEKWLNKILFRKQYKLYLRIKKK